MNDETARFRYQDYADQGRPKVMELPGPEFVRRFLLHVLPKGFARVRHFGFFLVPTLPRGNAYGCK